MKSTVLLPLMLVLALVSAGADDKKDDKKPADPPKLPLGRDTTFVMGPLDKQGYIDYEAALNAALGRGVTRDTNAVVLLLEVFGPKPEGSDLLPSFYKWIDAPPPPAGGEYLIDISTIGRQQFSLTDDQLGAIYEQMSHATKWPWNPKDNAPMAAWMKANEKPLNLAVRAVERRDYFFPIVSRRNDDSPGSLIGASLSSVQKCRELASLFAARAMLRVGEGKFDDAWTDILACHRLSRLISRGGTLIEGLVGVAIGQIAHTATLTYLDHAKLTPKQTAARLKEIDSLPPRMPLGDQFELTERMMGLETVQNMRRVGRGPNFPFDELFDGNALSDEEQKALEKIDYIPMMQTMNKWYDRMGAAMKIKDRALREKEFDVIDSDLAKVKTALTGDKLSKLLLAKGGPDKAASKAIGDVLMSLLMPAVRKVHMAYDRSEQADRNLRVAFALAAYRGEHGRYPKELADLAPDYLATVPADLFSDKPLIYKPTEKGYLFYSVGPNGKDDDGRYYDDTPPGDDPRVRMPVPEPKRNQ